MLEDIVKTNAANWREEILESMRVRANNDPLKQML